MDIQKLVDQRIEELLARQNHSFTPVKTEVDPREDPPADDLSDLGAVIEEAMMEVAERVLAISDRVAGDFARMEKDILDSRLAVLQSAEAVLDIAVSLRRKAKALTTTTAQADRQKAEVERQKSQTDRQKAEADLRKSFSDDELHLVEAVRELEESYMQDGRASMHDHGVASLFRRT